jgi:hypothetical protein
MVSVWFGRRSRAPSAARWRAMPSNAAASACAPYPPRRRASVNYSGSEKVTTTSDRAEIG